MARKKKEDNPDGLSAEEQEVMSAQEAGDDEPWEDEGEVVAVDEASGEETLPEPEKKPPVVEEVAGDDIENRTEIHDRAEEPKVPLGALDEQRHKYNAERDKRKDAETENAVLRDRLARLEAPAPVAPEEVPDPVVDFDGWKVWYARQREADALPMRQMTEQMQLSRQQDGLRQFAAASEAEFSVKTPDYPKALDFLREAKAKELRRWGIAEEEIPARVNAAAEWIVSEAHSREKNAGEMAYGYALAYGYKADQSSGDANQAMREVMAEPAGDKIERLAKAQKETQSTSNAGGSAREEEWTAERLAGLSDAEMAKVPDDVFRRVMGG
jgi:hypothetical protein